MKNTVKLERFCYSDEGTFGYLTLPSGDTLCTVERPWLDNKRSISCIPIGDYECSKRRYYRGGYDAIEVKGVPNRTHILFHKGNFVHNSNGCILVNSYFSASQGQWCGFNSKQAFERLMDYSKGFDLKIYNRVGGKNV